MTSYDNMPYTSNPFVLSSPGHLHTIGSLFRLDPPDYRTARVLEIGCASGGNITPLAYRYPQSEFFGIDLSKVQIKSGEAQIRALGLTNIRLKVLSLDELDERHGPFDYIICHGVFSWVTASLQNKIIELCSELLNPKGIAYISFNTFPGWTINRTIRDMMMFHVRGIEDSATKAEQARAILDFVVDGMREDDGPYARFLRTEALRLSEHEDSYLLHEYLEEQNNPLYFTQFMDMVRAHKLQYLSDAQFETMFVGNLPEDVGRRLGDLPDIVQTEQYIDFIRNRRFRRTLLCREDAPIERNLTPDDLTPFYISTKLEMPGTLKQAQLDDDSVQSFSIDDIDLNTDQPISKHAMYTLIQARGRPISFTALASDLAEKTGGSVSQTTTHLLYQLNLARLLLAGLIDIHSGGSDEPEQRSARPRASALVRHQARVSNQVTSLRHLPVKLIDMDRVLLTHLDGSRSEVDLAKLISDQIADGKLAMSNTGIDAISEDPSRPADLEHVIRQRLDLFFKIGLLES
ncbi:MAG: class I SAM-dependent methyltransferase [Proteobacteria bacterium]|nr:class I SAM-dependent methyltransferase [Pseudomonadota bacterium]